MSPNLYTTSWLVAVLIGLFGFLAPLTTRSDHGDRSVCDHDLRLSPGMGVELEAKDVVLVPTHCSTWGTEKRRPVVGRGGKMWALTGDHSPTIPRILFAEYVIDGTQVKVGGNPSVAELVAGEVEESMHILEQEALRSDVFVKIHNSSCESWKVERLRAKSPNREADKRVVWGAQVTAPMPLAMINEIFMWQTEHVHGYLPTWSRRVLRSPSASQPDSPVLHEMFDLALSTDLAPAGQSEDLLGLLALMLMVIRRSTVIRHGESPKHNWSIMPRTDFTSMFQSIWRGERFEGNLRTVLEKLLCFQYDGSTPQVDVMWCNGSIH